MTRRISHTLSFLTGCISYRRSPLGAMLVLAMAMIAMSACHKDEADEPRVPLNAVYDIVTIESTSEHGTIFTLQRGEDTPPIKYHVNYNFTNSENFKIGRRICICYNCIDATTYTSGEIKLYGYFLMDNTEQAVLAGNSDEYAGWKSQPIEIEALWRTGQYINMQLFLYSFKSMDPEKFVIVADASTISDPIPQLYVVYEPKEDNFGPNRMSAVASFDIGEVWNLPTCEGVNVIYRTADGSTNQLNFPKSNIQ